MVREIAIFCVVAFVIMSTAYQLYAIYTFINTGARFTLEDGHSLCARVLRLESIQGTVGGDCMFTQEKKR